MNSEIRCFIGGEEMARRSDGSFELTNCGRQHTAVLIHDCMPPQSESQANFNLRQVALDAAIRTPELLTSADYVTRAEVFYGFLKGNVTLPANGMTEGEARSMLGEFTLRAATPAA